MARSARPDDTNSGVVLVGADRLPAPKAIVERTEMPARSSRKGLLVGGLLAALVIGAGAGFLARPAIAPDTRVAVLEREVADRQTAIEGHETRATQLAQDLERAATSKAALAQEIEAQRAAAAKEEAELADKAAAAGKEMAALTAAVGTVGTLTSNGGEITLQLVDKELFVAGDDQLTDRGREILGQVGQAFTQLPGTQIWLQERTDEAPLPPPPAPRARSRRSAKPVVQPVQKFATNWELSAARARAAVRRLQETAKLEPSRVAIKIVLSPKKAKSKR